MPVLAWKVVKGVGILVSGLWVSSKLVEDAGDNIGNGLTKAAVGVGAIAAAWWLFTKVK